MNDTKIRRQGECACHERKEDMQVTTKNSPNSREPHKQYNSRLIKEASNKGGGKWRSYGCGERL